jgi:protein-L-isoaspartate(D-aspartate) O-methyltransferase
MNAEINAMGQQRHVMQAAQPGATAQAGHDAARRLMVLGQITPNGVIDPLLIEALGSIPREAFLPPAVSARAYADEHLPIAPGRVMLSPMVLARMIQLLSPQPGERALVLGAGVGYGAAVLARMGMAVTAVESDASFSDSARRGFAAAQLAQQPEWLEGNPAAGLPGGAPWRLILIEGAVGDLPLALTNQLGEGGRLCTLRAPGDGGPVARAVLIRRAGGALSERWAFETSAHPLPDFTAPPRFVF